MLSTKHCIPHHKRVGTDPFTKDIESNRVDFYTAGKLFQNQARQSETQPIPTLRSPTEYQTTQPYHNIYEEDLVQTHTDSLIVASVSLITSDSF